MSTGGAWSNPSHKLPVSATDSNHVDDVSSGAFLLAALGTGFDCASNGEISQVLALGSVHPNRIIFANPCKALSFVRNAAKLRVNTMTFDNADELKIARAHPRASLVLRILTDDTKALCQLGLKFGAPLHAVPSLLAKARELAVSSCFLCSQCPGTRRRRRHPTLRLVKTRQICLFLLFLPLLPAYPESEGPPVPVKPRNKLDKSMISSPASFSHLAHVVYDEEKRLVSSGVDSPLFDQELKERDSMSEEIGRRRRLSSDSIRSRMSSPTSPSLFSQLANGSLYENEKSCSELRVASLTELDRMDRSSVPMPTSSPYRAFTRRDSNADEAPSYFDPFADPEHPSHPHSVEARMDMPTSIDKSAISSPSPASFLHVAHMGHNTAKGIASTGFTQGSLAELFDRPRSRTESSGEHGASRLKLTNSQPFAPFSRAGFLERTYAFTSTHSRTSTSILATTPLDSHAVASFASSSRNPSRQSPMSSPSNAGPSAAADEDTTAADTATGCACEACVETAAEEGECEGEGGILGGGLEEEEVVKVARGKGWATCIASMESFVITSSPGSDDPTPL
ncbi:pyridoxal-dependent decarboxylase [Favolaschia claudopus]|uniref:Pyridoxal-dependent decarboxylase n=1 Tax=Favolaschia claudopus TaxID=2862362 RepID=A0AAW0DEU1_9AGAR